MSQPTIEDYTKQPIEEDGTYRAFPVTWTLEKADSGAIAIAIRFAIVRRWHGKETGWSQDYPLGWYSEGRTWIVKKPTEEQAKRGQDGSLSEGAIKNLAACGLWHGDFDAFAGPPPSIYVLIEIEGEEYQGVTRHRVNWINPDADEPKPRGAFAPVDRDLLHSLRAKHQAKTRAIGGGGAPSPTGAPSAPPTPAGASTPPSPAQAPPAQPGAPPAASGPPTGGPPAPVAPPAPQAAPPRPSAAAPGAPPQPPQWGSGTPSGHPSLPPAAPGEESPPDDAGEEFDPDKVPF